jgi:hypothetical protein
VNSGERGTNVTMIVDVNAIGKQVPPMLMFRRVDFNNHVLTGALTASIGGANPKVLSKESLFFDYLKHFITL